MADFFDEEAVRSGDEEDHRTEDEMSVDEEEGGEFIDDDAPPSDVGTPNHQALLQEQLGSEDPSQAESDEEAEQAASADDMDDDEQAVGADDMDDDEELKDPDLEGFQGRQSQPPHPSLHQRGSESSPPSQRSRTPSPPAALPPAHVLNAAETHVSIHTVWNEIRHVYTELNSFLHEQREETSFQNFAARSKELSALWKTLASLPDAAVIACYCGGIDPATGLAESPGLQATIGEVGGIECLRQVYALHTGKVREFQAEMIKREYSGEKEPLEGFQKTSTNTLFVFTFNTILSMEAMALTKLNLLALSGNHSLFPINTELTHTLGSLPFYSLQYDAATGAEVPSDEKEVTFNTLRKYVLGCAKRDDVRYSGNQVFIGHTLQVVDEHGVTRTVKTGFYQPWRKPDHMEHTSLVSNYIAHVCQCLDYPDIIRKHGSTHNHNSRLAEYITSSNTREFPELKVSRYFVAFNNGVWDYSTDTFFPYLKEQPFLQSDVKVAHFIPFRFPSTKSMHDEGYNVMTDEELSTPKFLKILRDQRLYILGRPETEAENIFWALAFFGKLLHWGGDFDTWQMTFILYGIAGTGKSMIFNILRAMMPPERVAEISSNCEETFGMSALASKPAPFALICGELKHNTSIPQALIQSLVSGDAISVSAKFKDPVTITRTTIPLAMAGNELPDVWHDAANSMGRRFMIIPFLYSVLLCNRDDNLAQSIINSDELPKVMVKIIRAYHTLAKYTRETGRSALHLMPEFYRQSSSILRKTTNPLYEFFSENCVVKLNGALRYTTMAQWQQLANYGFAVSLADFCSAYQTWAARGGRKNRANSFRAEEIPVMLAEVGCTLTEAPISLDIGSDNPVEDKFLLGLHLRGYSDERYKQFNEALRDPATALFDGDEIMVAELAARRDAGVNPHPPAGGATVYPWTALTMDEICVPEPVSGSSSGTRHKRSADNQADEDLSQHERDSKRRRSHDKSAKSHRKSATSRYNNPGAGPAEDPPTLKPKGNDRPTVKPKGNGRPAKRVRGGEEEEDDDE